LDSDEERKIQVQWNISSKGALRRHVRVRVVSLDEPGLLALMSQTIAACGVNIASANIRTTKDKKAIAIFDIEVNDLKQFQKVVSSLEGKKGVISVERVRS
jgi:GTP pyrophosphokinase